MKTAIREKLLDIYISKGFVGYYTKGSSNKSKNIINRLHQTKTFSTGKETTKLKSKLQSGRKYLPTIYLLRN
jgi:hypothetical protein